MNNKIFGCILIFIDFNQEDIQIKPSIHMFSAKIRDFEISNLLMLFECDIDK